MAAREAKMALRIARWPSGKKDEGPGTLDERPGTKKSRQEARKRSIQSKPPAGKPKTGRDTKIAVRIKKIRAGTEKTSPGAGNSLRARGSLTSEVRQEDGMRGRPPGGAVSMPRRVERR